MDSEAGRAEVSGKFKSAAVGAGAPLFSSMKAIALARNLWVRARY